MKKLIFLADLIDFVERINHNDDTLDVKEIERNFFLYFLGSIWK